MKKKKDVSPACIWKKKSLSNFPLVKSIITKCKKCKSFLYSFIHEHVQAIIITLAKWKCNKLFMMEQEYVGKINTISVSIFIHENRSCMIVTIIIRDIFSMSSFVLSILMRHVCEKTIDIIEYEPVFLVRVLFLSL